MTFSRTPAGDAEVLAKAMPLSIPMRKTLSLVGKNSTLDEIKAAVRFGEVERLLNELIALGLVRGTATSTASPPQVDAATRSHQTAQLASVVTDFKSTRQRIARFITDHLGPDSDTLCIRIERCADALSLEQAAYDARRVLFDLRGRSIADKFTREVLVPAFGDSAA
jgi:hypothetical protein